MYYPFWNFCTSVCGQRLTIANIPSILCLIRTNLVYKSHEYEGILSEKRKKLTWKINARTKLDMISFYLKNNTTKPLPQHEQTVIFPADAQTLSTGNKDIWQEISKTFF